MRSAESILLEWRRRILGSFRTLKKDLLDYEKRYLAEQSHFNNVENVHALPDIYHYWSNRYLKPKFSYLGIRGIYEFFVDNLFMASKRTDKRPLFISIGSGHSDIEANIVEQLIDAGVKDFIFECIDINPNMLERGKALAEEKGLLAYMRFIAGDASSWNPTNNTYAGVIANHSLHHIEALELLFGKIRKAIGPSGVFVTSDMIGRNGHMRWPEALFYVNDIWQTLPDRCKYNHLLRRFEAEYENWDCSKEGFEGIRAQDILPLLVKNFHFEIFLGFSNLIDIFIDRCFGHNFDPKSPLDCAIIDKIALQDETLLESGEIKPTHIIATMRTTPVANPKYYKHLSPEYCVRPV